MAVGKPGYKGVIERALVCQTPLFAFVRLCVDNLGHQFCCHFFQDIHCLFVMEVMWGLQNIMHFLVPQEKMKLRNKDRVPMSQGLKVHLNRYGFDVKLDMVNANILMAACILFDCENSYVKNSKILRLAGEIIKDISGIDPEFFDLMEFATVLKIICYHAERTISEEAMFTQNVVNTLVRDAHKYESKIDKGIYLKAYHQIVDIHKDVAKTRKILEFLASCCLHVLANRAEGSAK
ncbi:hypothetical protein U9M48_036923, partial [Paspalum notatum var. saurae]